MCHRLHHHFLLPLLGGHLLKDVGQPPLPQDVLPQDAVERGPVNLPPLLVQEVRHADQVLEVGQGLLSVRLLVLEVGGPRPLELPAPEQLVHGHHNGLEPFGPRNLEDLEVGDEGHGEVKEVLERGGEALLLDGLGGVHDVGSGHGDKLRNSTRAARRTSRRLPLHKARWTKTFHVGHRELGGTECRDARIRDFEHFDCSGVSIPFPPIAKHETVSTLDAGWVQDDRGATGDGTGFLSLVELVIQEHLEGLDVLPLPWRVVLAGQLTGHRHPVGGPGVAGEVKAGELHGVDIAHEPAHDPAVPGPTEVDLGQLDEGLLHSPGGTRLPAAHPLQGVRGHHAHPVETLAQVPGPDRGAEVFWVDGIRQPQFHRFLILLIGHDHILKHEDRLIEIGGGLGPHIEGKGVHGSTSGPHLLHTAHDLALSHPGHVVDLHGTLGDAPRIEVEGPHQLLGHPANLDVVREEPVHVAVDAGHFLVRHHVHLVPRVNLEELMVGHQLGNLAGDSLLNSAPERGDEVFKLRLVEGVGLHPDPGVVGLQPLILDLKTAGADFIRGGREPAGEVVSINANWFSLSH